MEHDVRSTGNRLVCIGREQRSRFGNAAGDITHAAGRIWICSFIEVTEGDLPVGVRNIVGQVELPHIAKQITGEHVIDPQIVIDINRLQC